MKDLFHCFQNFYFCLSCFVLVPVKLLYFTEERGGKIQKERERGRRYRERERERERDCDVFFF